MKGNKRPGNKSGSKSQSQKASKPEITSSKTVNRQQNNSQENITESERRLLQALRQSKTVKPLPQGSVDLSIKLGKRYNRKAFARTRDLESSEDDTESASEPGLEVEEEKSSDTEAENEIEERLSEDDLYKPDKQLKTEYTPEASMKFKTLAAVYKFGETAATPKKRNKGGRPRKTEINNVKKEEIVPAKVTTRSKDPELPRTRSRSSAFVQPRNNSQPKRNLEKRKPGRPRKTEQPTKTKEQSKVGQSKASKQDLTKKSHKRASDSRSSNKSTREPKLYQVHQIAFQFDDVEIESEVEMIDEGKQTYQDFSPEFLTIDLTEYVENKSDDKEDQSTIPDTYTERSKQKAQSKKNLKQHRHNIPDDIGSPIDLQTKLQLRKEYKLRRKEQEARLRMHKSVAFRENGDWDLSSGEKYKNKTERIASKYNIVEDLQIIGYVNDSPEINSLFTSRSFWEYAVEKDKLLGGTRSTESIRERYRFYLSELEEDDIEKMKVWELAYGPRGIVNFKKKTMEDEFGRLYHVRKFDRIEFESELRTKLVSSKRALRTLRTVDLSSTKNTKKAKKLKKIEDNSDAKDTDQPNESNEPNDNKKKPVGRPKTIKKHNPTQLEIEFEQEVGAVSETPEDRELRERIMRKEQKGGAHISSSSEERFPSKKVKSKPNSSIIDSSLVSLFLNTKLPQKIQEQTKPAEVQMTDDDIESINNVNYPEKHYSDDISSLRTSQPQSRLISQQENNKNEDPSFSSPAKRNQYIAPSHKKRRARQLLDDDIEEEEYELKDDIIEGTRLPFMTTRTKGKLIENLELKRARIEARIEARDEARIARNVTRRAEEEAKRAEKEARKEAKRDPVKEARKEFKKARQLLKQNPDFFTQFTPADTRQPVSSEQEAADSMESEENSDGLTRKEIEMVAEKADWVKDLSTKYGCSPQDILDIFYNCSMNPKILDNYFKGADYLLWTPEEDDLLREGRDMVIRVLSKYKNPDNVRIRQQFLQKSQQIKQSLPF